MIILITGQQGSGKTLLAVKEILSYTKKGYKIVSNVNLNNISHELLDYDKVMNCEYEKAVVFIDEIHQILPARRSMSKTSVRIVDGFLSMIRKKEVILIGTTQFERKVDSRLRLEKDYFVTCKRFLYKNGAFIPASPDFKDPFAICVIDVEMECVYNQERKKAHFIANKYYKYYDTKQIIAVNSNK